MNPIHSVKNKCFCRVVILVEHSGGEMSMRDILLHISLMSDEVKRVKKG